MTSLRGYQPSGTRSINYPDGSGEFYIQPTLVSPTVTGTATLQDASIQGLDSKGLTQLSWDPDTSTLALPQNGATITASQGLIVGQTIEGLTDVVGDDFQVITSGDDVSLFTEASNLTLGQSSSVLTVPGSINCSTTLTVSNLTYNGTSAIVHGVANEPNLPCFDVANATTITDATGDGTLVEVPFATKNFDQTNSFSSPSFTAPRAGVYLFTASVCFSNVGSAHTRGSIVLEKNGLAAKWMITNPAAQRDVNNNVQLMLTTPISLAINDTVYVTAEVLGGTKVVGVGDSDQYANYFTGVFLC